MNQSQKKQGALDRVQEEINEEIHPLLQKIHDHIKEIGIVVGAVVLVAAGVTGYKFYQQKTIQNARAELNRITSQNQGQEAIKALQSFLPEAPEDIRQAVRLEVASRSMASEDYDLAAQTWQDIHATAQDPNLQVVASLGRAKALRLAGKLGQSLEILDQLLDMAPKEYIQSINFERAAVAEENGQWQKALNAYQDLKSETSLTASNQGYLDYKIAQLQGKLEQSNS